PLDSAMWPFVPGLLNERVLPRGRVHHIDIKDAVSAAGAQKVPIGRFLRDTGEIGTSAATFGVTPVVKSLYAAAKAWAWARSSREPFDHILSYWGNYAATAAYLFH